MLLITEPNSNLSLKFSILCFFSHTGCLHFFFLFSFCLVGVLVGFFLALGLQGTSLAQTSCLRFFSDLQLTVLGAQNSERNTAQLPAPNSASLSSITDESIDFHG